MITGKEYKNKCITSTPISIKPCGVNLKIIKGLEKTIINYFINNPTRKCIKPKRVTFKDDLVSLRRIHSEVDTRKNHPLDTPVDRMVNQKELTKNDVTVEKVVDELFADCPNELCKTKDEKMINSNQALFKNVASGFSKSGIGVNKSDKKNFKEKSFI